MASSHQYHFSTGWCGAQSSPMADCLAAGQISCGRTAVTVARRHLAATASGRDPIASPQHPTQILDAAPSPANHSPQPTVGREHHVRH
jgi:hypothetical protein